MATKASRPYVVLRPKDHVVLGESDFGMTARVPYGSFDQSLLTIEWTPLEPKVIDEKYYAPGVGLVPQRAAAGGDERAELVSVAAGP